MASDAAVSRRLCGVILNPCVSTAESKRRVTSYGYAAVCLFGRERPIHLGVMREPVAVHLDTRGLIIAGQRRSAVPAFSSRPDCSHRFHCVTCPNPWPTPERELRREGRASFEAAGV